MMRSLVIYVAFFTVGCLAERNEQMRRFVGRNTKNYTLASAPIPANSPLDIGVTMYVLDVSEINIHKMEYTIQMYFRQIWKDTRVPPHIREELRKEQVNFGYGKGWTFDDLETIWKPDLFFIEERRSFGHDQITPNNFLRIKDNGEIKYSKRVTLTLGCPMYFGAFPHDTQHCNLSIESYGYNADQMILKWDKGANSVGISEFANTTVSDYNVLPMVLGTSKVFLSTGNYTRLVIHVSFERRIGFFLTKLYLPYIFLVLVTGFTFWIDLKLVFARLCVVLTVLLIMMSLAFQMDYYTPDTPYTKAIDVWIGYCLTFTFTALLEYVFICCIEKRCTNSAINRAKNGSILITTEDEVITKKDKAGDIEVDASTTKFVARNLCQVYQWSIHIDVIFRYLYPLLFAVFNLIYWCAYAS